MNPIAKLVLFGVILAAAAGAGAAVGAAVGPIDVGGTDEHAEVVDQHVVERTDTHDTSAAESGDNAEERP